MAKEVNVHGKKRHKRLQNANPLQQGISTFLESESLLASRQIDHADLPKRYTVYSCLLLLPPNFSSQSSAWKEMFASLTAKQRLELFSNIVKAFKGQNITHVAINAPIASVDEEGKPANEIRRPSGLTPVFGDFGPDSIGETCPSKSDFDAAFWVSLSQHQNVVQCWAPRWTMFSRGNMSEKARILNMTGSKIFSGLSSKEPLQRFSAVDVVDMYVGIGYFASCYLKRGVRVVFGWDLNPWSIEGLKRGCAANGWRCEVVKLDDAGNIEADQIKGLVRMLGDNIHLDRAVRCVAFLGDNRNCGKVMQMLGNAVKGMDFSLEFNVRHINMGLLPTSQGSWSNAVSILNEDLGGWLHVHENAEVHKIADKEEEILQTIRDLVAKTKKGRFSTRCTHIEKVKMFGPGIMHCVFDVEILPAR